MSKLPFFFFLFFPLFFLFLSHFLFFLSSLSVQILLQSSPRASSPFLCRPHRAPSPPAASGPRRRELGPPVAGRLGHPATASSRRRRPPQGPRHREILPPPAASGPPAATTFSLRRWLPRGSSPPRAPFAAGRLLLAGLREASLLVVVRRAVMREEG